MKISRSDFDWAVKQDLISLDQADKLWEGLLSQKSDKPRFVLGHVIYYFGAMIILAAMGWFMTLGWDSLGGGGIFLTSLAYAILFGLIGNRFWQEASLKIPGGLLYTAAVWMTPLIVYGFQRMTGLWPQGYPGSFPGYHLWVKGSWFAMEMATIIVGAVVLKFIRFPFLTFPIAFSLWYMSMDMTPLLFGKDDYSLDERKLVSVIFGLAMLLVTYLVDRISEKDYANWGYLFGLLSFWGGLSAMDSNSELGKFIYCLINLGLMGASVFLMRKVFLVFGAIGVFIYLGHLAHVVFKDSLLFPVALSSIGLFIIFAGVQYQKNEVAIERMMDRVLPAKLKGWRPVQKA
jgi:hypothetical protein